MSVQASHTRCPQCKTRFRVTEAQLAVARGKVRCGQCQTVFNALEHQLDDPGVPPSPTKDPAQAAAPTDPATTTPTPAPAPPPAEKPQETPTEEDPSEEEFLFQDDPEIDSTERNYTGQTGSDEDELSSTFLALDEEADWHEAMDEQLQSKPVDESWADSLLDDDDQGFLSDQEHSKQDSPPPATATELTSESVTSSASATDDDDWNDLVDWESLDGFPDAPSAAATDDSPQAPPQGVSPGAAAPLMPQQTPPAAGESGGDWRQLQAEPIAASPVQADQRYRWWWRGLALLLTAILLVQLTWVQRQHLATHEWLRPVYVQACDWLGCSIATQVDRSQLTSRDLVVRSHPDSPGALLVEARLHNRASFAQPLPAVALSFSNLNGDIIAQRVFRPSEYLDTEQPVTEIGANRALPIKLSLQDPGREAINYRVDFLGLPQ